ncbi:MAG: NADH-quinone oxidoreductase subunit C [Candidatus Omnitrophota bacterium]|jgi:Ni,Fe-hydrogenase III component G
MSKEEEILQALVKKFGFLENRIKTQRPRRILADVDIGNFKTLLDYAVKELRFPILLTMTGLDEGEKIAVIYHMASEDGCILNIRTAIAKVNPSLKTITDIFPNADIYERELEDLLGIKVDGLAPGNRYPLPDGWPAGEYPLRKDWKKNKEKVGDDHA